MKHGDSPPVAFVPEDLFLRTSSRQPFFKETKRVNPIRHRKRKVVEAVAQEVCVSDIAVRSGMRRADAARQILFRTDELDIDLTIAEGTAIGKKTILGQVLPRSSDDFYANARIDLQHESLCLATTANDLGEFRFDNMPSGEMRLEITFPDYNVVGYFMVPDVQKRSVVEEGFKNVA